jgi:hypothetical protein
MDLVAIIGSGIVISMLLLQFVRGDFNDPDEN